MGKLIFSGTGLLVAGGFFLLACCVFACAGALVFGLAGSYEDDAKEIQDMPEFSSASDNTKIVATGAISDAQVITSDPVLGNMTEYGFIGYQVDRFDVSRSSSRNNSSDNRTSSWKDVSSAFNPFSLDNGEIHVNPSDTMTIDGDVHETLISPTSDTNGLSDTYNGETVKDGTLRLQGFQNGDLITVIGIRRGNEIINAEKLYGGTRDEWVSDLKGQAEDSRNAGYIVGVCGLCFLLPGLAIAGGSIYGRRMFKANNASAPAMNPTFGTYGSGTVGSPFGTPYGQGGQPGQFGQASQPGPSNPQMPFGAGQSNPSGPSSGASNATPVGSSTPPATPPSSNIPGGFWGGSSNPSPFDPPKDAPSPFDPPKDDSDSPFGSSNP